MKITSQVLDTEVRQGSLRVAFASSDNETINDHFGRAMSFLIYDVSRSGYHKAGKIQFSTGEDTASGNPENKHFEKVNALSSCHIVYSQSIGGPVAARLTQRKIHPLVVKNNPAIDDLLNDLKSVLNRPLPPWLRKITGLKEPKELELV